MARRPASESVSREDILWATAAVLHREGYASTTMKDIADEIGITAASLYHHFDNKDILLLSVLEIGLDLTIEKIEKVSAGTNSCADRLAAMVRSHVHNVTNNVTIAAAMVFELRTLMNINISPRHADREFAQDFVERRKAFFRRRQTFEDMFRQTIEAGVAAGEFRSVDADIVTKMMLGAQNWVGLWFRESGRLTGEQVADTMVDTWLAALRAA